jgi:hypothetical protein
MLRAEIKVAEPTIPATGSGSSSSPPASGTAYTPSSLTNAQSTLVSDPPSATQSSSTTATSSSLLNAVSSSTKLGMDAIIGIAVGGVVLIAIAGIIGCMFFRYRQRRSPKGAVATGYPAYNTSLTPLGREKSQQWSTVSPPTSGSELEYRPQRVELGQGRYVS